MPKRKHEIWLELKSPTRRYKSDLFRGVQAEEARKNILTVLSARGMAVPEEAHARITECADPDQLEVWVRRADTAGTIDDLFG